MTIILFLIDTSASMNQRTYLGTTLIDVAKGAVEAFMKLRSRDLNSRWDRYMLLTFENPPAHIKAGWKENHATLMTELRNIQATGMTNMGPALKNALDLLNTNRMQSGVDAYGSGRVPFYLEPAVIIVITDGDKMTHDSGVSPELHLPMTGNSFPGEDLCREPFRWDQRIFSLVLRIPASVPPESGPNLIVPNSNHPIENMCEVTGGRSYAISSQKMLNSAVESLVSKVIGGVVLHFERTGGDPPLVMNEYENGFKAETGADGNGNLKENDSGNRQMQQNLQSAEVSKFLPTVGTGDWQNCRKLIIVPRSAQRGGYYMGHWPIPESFLPDPNSPTLQPRDAQPTVHFSCLPTDPVIIDNLPFDKYEVEPCALTRFILDRKQPNSAWQVFVPNSGKYETVMHPFGYLKPSSSLNSVNLFVLPYNYPQFMRLIDELLKTHKGKVNPRWKSSFDNYIKDVPSYYMAYLRRALLRMGIANIMSDYQDMPLNYSVSTNLKKFKNQAKVECDRLIASVGQKIPGPESITVEPRAKASILQRKDFNQLLQNNGNGLAGMTQELQDFTKFSVALKNKNIQRQYFRNPYDIPRKYLLDQAKRMLVNFLQTKHNHRKFVDDDQMHSVPVQQMGNYQEYLKKQPQPLRELESQPVRLHTFGNPFKVKQDMMIDEADDAFMGQNAQKKRPSTPHSPMAPGAKRKKPGPLSRDVPIRRPSSPHPGSMSPMSSSESVCSDSDSENELMIVEDDEREEGSEDLMNGGEQQQNHQYVFESPTEMAPVQAVIPRGVTEKKMAQLCSHNRKLKMAVFKEVKSPGRDHKALFAHLKSVQGGLEARKAFIEETIMEANRFKRKYLIRQLEQFMERMTQQVEPGRGSQMNNISRANLNMQR